MKKIKNKFFFLLTILLLLTVSCGKSNKSNIENFVSEELLTDDYAILFESNTPQKIVEDLSGKVIILTENDFIERITTLYNPRGFQYLGHTPCIVVIYADWCRQCSYQSYIMNELAPEYKEKVIFYKLNIDRANQVRSVFNVESIPMILFFKPRGEIFTSVGFLNKAKLNKMIADLLLNS